MISKEYFGIEITLRKIREIIRHERVCNECIALGYNDGLDYALRVIDEVIEDLKKSEE